MEVGLLIDNFSEINASKANFDNIYTMPDPRAYFSILGALDYMIPDIAEPVSRQILTAFSRQRQRKPCVLDIGCSYGINAAVHRFPLNFDILRRRYTCHEIAALSPDELMRMDRNYFSSWPETGIADFIGLDISDPAVTYAKTVGLLREGIVADLENNFITPEQSAIVRQADVILSTGCVGYVSERTYSQLLDSMQQVPWVISFVLRMFPYDRFEKVMSSYGLVTEKLTSATFIQRRFRDEDEFESTLGTLTQLGIDPTGFESEGLWHAELYLSRPAEDARAMSLDEIVTVTSGRNRPTGARYVRVETDNGRLQVAIEP
jgi:SAM-dependent methyltransferase